MNSFFDKLLDTIAPRRKSSSEIPISEGRLVTDEELKQELDRIQSERNRRKLEMDAEIADLKQQADYLEEKAKQEKRIQAVTPARSPLFGGGGSPAGSILSTVWKRIPMKPVVVPLGLVIFVLVCFKAC